MKELLSHIRDVPDFPRPGIVFKDITPLLGNARALQRAVDAMTEPFANDGVTVVAGVEARGFLFAAPIALKLGCGVALLRKPGKLPFHTHRVEYELEYGKDAIEIHQDAVTRSDRVLLVDDVIATGGTIRAAAELVSGQGAKVIGLTFLIELGFLSGRSRLEGYRVHSVLAF
ncbi:MAG: adenine phosphoribosyltransferase [Candidatus Schekmanbacteria bacterium]|nr:adenine phosphoribosyltransferase [Candidatus Schekmanbacteria bacterium]